MVLEDDGNNAAAAIAAGPSIDALKSQRSSSKGSISRMKNAVENNQNLSTIELECRLAMIETYYKQASYYQTEIEKQAPTDQGRTDIDELYIVARTVILTRLSNLRVDNSMNSTSFLTPAHHTKKLPNLRLPKFDGSYLDYKNFINSFNSLIHNDANIAIIEKFNHLLSCLSGEALATVKTFQVTEVNYPKALARLKERYDNDTLIFLENIAAIFDLEKVTKAESLQLRNIVDTISALYNSLKSLGQHEQICDGIMIHLAVSKVDSETKRKWDEFLDYSTLPKWSECCAMLDKRCQQLDASSRRNMKSTTAQSPSSKPAGKSKKVSMATKTESEKLCNFCSKNTHYMNACQLFLGLDPQRQLSEVTQRSLCVNCLSPSHSTTQCKSKHFCRFCKQRHHSLLHSSFQNQPSSATSTPTAAHREEESTSTTMATCAASSSTSTVLLATAVVLIKDAAGAYHLARALLDSCSQVNIMSEKLFCALNLKRYRTDVEICGVGSMTESVTYKTQTTIRSRINSFATSLEFLVTPKITGYQPDETIKQIQAPYDIKLADPEYEVSRGIDILLGTECFFNILEPGKVVLNNDLPILQQTSLGWVVTGKCRLPTSSHTANSFGITNQSLRMLNENVEKFWKIEEIQTKRRTTLEQEQCESHFKNSVAIDQSGRISVALPFKQDYNLLGNSRDVALRRFLALERKLNKNKSLKADYSKFMSEYESLGHMTLWPSPNLSDAHYFIPHHCVIKPSSETTKLRVVFDASCKTASQLSLNDILMVGPTIQNDLAITLLRFRYHRYGLMADVTKMYRQVLVHADNRRFQLILWRADSSQPVNTYVLNTVTYGTAAAPFLAIRSLQYAAETSSLPHVLGKNIIVNDFYVDDMVTGADDWSTIHQIKTEVVEILEQFKFSLCKWHCSHPKFLSTGSRELRLDDDVTRALGVTWHPDTDVFEFSFKPKPHNEITKRSLLSLTSSLFDPLGLISPIIIRARILLQHLWREKYNWDDPVSVSIRDHWTEIASDLQNLQAIQIPRFVRCANSVEVQLHGFADASQQAYGCCFYIRCTDTAGNISINLLLSRARVAPLKTRTLPRLELSAAHLLALTLNQIKTSFSFQITKYVFWTDSQITLHWIKSESSTLTTFVGNRVAEIQEYTNSQDWRFVPTQHNPADLTSRGCSVPDLKSSIWLHGPMFLQKDNSNWPPDFKGYNEFDDEYLASKRKSAFMCGPPEIPYLLRKINEFSNYKKCLHVFARMLQFATKKPSAIVTAAEMKAALFRVIYVIQQHRFATEIKQLMHKQPVTGNLVSLTPILDDTKSPLLLRVGGRLVHAEIETEAKFPILLPKDEPFVKVIVRHYHYLNYHAGPRALVALLQQQFWIVNCKALATQVVHECIHCRRYQPRLLTQIMGDLPKHRVTLSRPFNITGVDFAGPISTYLGIRGKTPYKTYIAVFVCFSTKAVHLEAVSALSSDAFIAALKRFIGRRGMPSVIWCDNATNFVGAAAKLKEFRDSFLQTHYIDDVTSYCADHHIEFSFIPPRAPHFGGLWEAAVKTSKAHMFRTLPNAKLTFEELMTALIEIEAVMNSRPLVASSTNPNDLEALTPSHLLNGFGLKNLPEEADMTSEISHIQRWQRITAIKAHFWKRWHREYLTDLQNRYRWQRPNANPKVNDLVIIQDDNLPPMKWTLGRITKVIFGSDGHARVVDIKTPKTTLRRPITKIAILPVN